MMYKIKQTKTPKVGDVAFKINDWRQEYPFDIIEVVKCDVSLPFESIIKKLEGHTFDGIFHLACHPRSLSLENPFREPGMVLLASQQVSP